MIGKTKLIAIVATTPDAIIGIGNEIPWRLPEDLKHFRETTMGSTLIVGYRTYLSLPPKAFEGRQYLVYNRNFLSDTDVEREGVRYFRTLAAMRQFITDSNLDKIYVAGGEFIYHEFLEDCDEIVMTMVDIEYPENEQNKYFPLGTLSMRFTMLGESNWIESKTGINYKFINYMQKVNDRFIDIIVCGNSSSGKSTIINEIYRFLWTRGFSVELNLEGNSDYRDEAVFRRQMNDGNEEQRLAAIKTTKIKLKEVPAVTSFRDEKK